MGDGACWADPLCTGVTLGPFPYKVDQEQKTNRHIIRFCDTFFQFRTEKSMPWTALGLSGLQLDTFKGLQLLAALPMVTIIHELAHVRDLSSQNFEYPTNGLPEGRKVAISLLEGVDTHGSEEQDGLFTEEPNRNSLVGPRLKLWQRTVMNPDSYGNFALMYRLRRKQWKAKLEKIQGVDTIVFEKGH
ncbi:unnamed protein product [Periconia digitata]|uniref:Uncharacterized protein n=1 Tax=Periconia digitata TaxID=1303443 RepID=A0A9W4U6X9_9PLEO|nr:unnamed protein product [Periconia digitata]